MAQPVAAGVPDGAVPHGGAWVERARVPHPWADRIKAHPRVRLVEVTEATRDTLPERLAAWLGDPRACGAGGAP